MEQSYCMYKILVILVEKLNKKASLLIPEGK